MTGLQLIRLQSWLMNCGLSADHVIELEARRAVFDAPGRMDHCRARLVCSANSAGSSWRRLSGTTEAIVRWWMRRLLRPFLPCPAPERARHLAEFLRLHPELMPPPATSSSRQAGSVEITVKEGGQA